MKGTEWRTIWSSKAEPWDPKSVRKSEMTEKSLLSELHQVYVLGNKISLHDNLGLWVKLMTFKELCYDRTIPSWNGVEKKYLFFLLPTTIKAGTMVSGGKSTFHCGPGTTFNQKVRVCDWPNNSYCESAPDWYVQKHCNNIILMALTFKLLHTL